MNFQAAIFDMDGLLLDTERLSKDSFIETCKYFNLNKDFDFFYQLIGLNAASGKRLIEEFLDGAVLIETFEEKLKGTYRASLAQHVPVKDGAKTLLAHLNDIGLPCAVATSSGYDSACDKLHRSELLPFFESVTGGDQVENGKPAPDIFLLAATRLNVEAKHCIAFEDSENGVKAAVGAGMKVVQVPDLVPPSDELRSLNHHVADTLLEGAARLGVYSGG